MLRVLLMQWSAMHQARHWQALLRLMLFEARLPCLTSIDQASAWGLRI
jgi:hypothetical protein